MPQAIDLVLDNGATPPVPKTFTLNTPAAGDNGVAEWALKEGVISSVFPKITAQARRTGNNSRKSIHKIRIPSSYTDSVTGLTKVGSAFEVNIDASVPDDFPEALKNDAVAFASNYLADALAQAMIRDGLPAT